MNMRADPCGPIMMWTSSSAKHTQAHLSDAGASFAICPTEMLIKMFVRLDWVHFTLIKSRSAVEQVARENENDF